MRKQVQCEPLTCCVKDLDLKWNTSKALRSRIRVCSFVGRREAKEGGSIHCVSWREKEGEPLFRMSVYERQANGREGDVSSVLMQGCAPCPLTHPSHGCSPAPPYLVQNHSLSAPHRPSLWVLGNQSTDEKDQRSQKEFSSVFLCQPTRQRRKEHIWHHKNCNLGLQSWSSG